MSFTLSRLHRVQKVAYCLCFGACFYALSGSRYARMLSLVGVCESERLMVIMVEIIGVRFKNAGKVYSFDPAGITFKQGDNVIVETARGVELGEVVQGNKHTKKESLVSPLKSVIRKATDGDLKQSEENRAKEKEAFDICVQKITEHELDMHLVDVQYTFDRNKVLFYFTSEGRVDFRELVKSLASVFRTRIELRQIGVRDEAKMLGGLGICGRTLCCGTFVGDFEPVSIKMAKEQSLSLNPTKISGSCGRLMCCLKYEQATYEALLKSIPKVDAIVETPKGRGVVIDVYILRGVVKVMLNKENDGLYHTFKADEIKIIKNAQTKLTPEEIKALKDLEDN